MQQQKTVSISSSLFSYLVRYFLCEDETPEIKQLIEQELESKLEAIKRRELYTTYKTGSRAEREHARQLYLESRGINSDFRY